MEKEGTEKKKGLEKELSWRAAEFEYVEKNLAWYLAVLGVAGVVVLIAFIRGNFFFGIFMVLAAILITVLGRQKPRVFDFRISDSEVKVGDSVSLSYDNLESFSVNRREGRLDEIILKKKSIANSYVRIPADTAMSEKARGILSEKLPEEEYEESLVDILADRLGF